MSEKDWKIVIFYAGVVSGVIAMFIASVITQ